MRRIILILVSFVFMFSLCSFNTMAQDKKKAKDTKKTEAVKDKSKKTDTKVEKKADAPTTVYVLEKGNAYHKKNCRLVKSGKKGITLEEAKKQKYEPCKICNPPK
jgi:hypothetical protein